MLICRNTEGYTVKERLGTPDLGRTFSKRAVSLLVDAWSGP